MRLPPDLVAGALAFLGLALTVISLRTLVKRDWGELGCASTVGFGLTGVAGLVWQVPGLAGFAAPAELVETAEALFFVLLGGSVLVWTNSVLSRHAGRLETEAHERLEAQRQVEDALERERLLVDVLSHDVRNQLGLAIPLMDLAEKNNPELEETLDDVRVPVENAADLLEEAVEYLRLAELDPAEAELTPLGHLVEQVCQRVEPMAEAAGVTVETDLEEVQAAAVHPMLDRAFQNLVANAIKFSPEASTVEVQGGHDGERLILAVVDHGPGVDAEDLEEVFERFETGDDGEATGSGLGLAITGRIVETLGGQLTLRETPGGGAAFVIEIDEEDASLKLPGSGAAEDEGDPPSGEETCEVGAPAA